MLLIPAPNRSPAARSGVFIHPALTVGEDFRKRGRTRHQNDADPQPTQTGEFRDLIAITGQFRSGIDDHRRTQEKDGPRHQPFTPDHQPSPLAMRPPDDQHRVRG